jgi:hypothetical protein
MRPRPRLRSRLATTRPLARRARLVGINHVALEEAGVEILPGRGLDFRDPWGNHLQIVEYGEIQFTKAPNVLEAMGMESLEKGPEALRELREKGIKRL